MKHLVTLGRSRDKGLDSVFTLYDWVEMPCWKHFYRKRTIFVSNIASRQQKQSSPHSASFNYPGQISLAFSITWMRGKGLTKGRNVHLQIAFLFDLSTSGAAERTTEWVRTSAERTEFRTARDDDRVHQSDWSRGWARLRRCVLRLPNVDGSLALPTQSADVPTRFRSSLFCNHSGKVHAVIGGFCAECWPLLLPENPVYHFLQR